MTEVRDMAINFKQVNKQVNVYLPEGLITLLKHLAIDNNESVSSLVHRIILSNESVTTRIKEQHPELKKLFE